MVDEVKVRRALKVLYYRSLCLLLTSNRRGIFPYEESPLKQWLTRFLPGNKNAAVRLIILCEPANAGFTGWLGRKARVNRLEYGVYIRNKKTIEVVLIGPSDKIITVIENARKGPKNARVLKVVEYWFNKPQKNIRKGPVKEQAAWSQETAKLIHATIEYLDEIMRHPNQYYEPLEMSQEMQLKKHAADKNLFVTAFNKSIYILSPDKQIGIQGSLSSRVSSTVRSLTDHKELTKKHLYSYGLPVPEGRVFTDFQAAKDYFAEKRTPFVVKPVTGLHGHGITVDVRTKEALELAWDYARRYHDQVILEELAQGVDIRVLVIGGSACAALLRIPANIMGDGRRTIEELIDEKNRTRLQNPRLAKELIVPDSFSIDFLARQGFSLQSVPREGEIIFLHLKANIGAGGDSVTVTGFIHPDLLRLSEEAAAVFGAKDLWGIDLLVERIDLPREQQRCFILEVNPKAALRGVQYPIYGKPVNAGKLLINHLFSENIHDHSYELMYIRVKITGILCAKFFDWACENAGVLELRGHIQPVGHGAEALVLGRRQRLLTFLDKIWEWKGESGGVVDGIQIFPHDGTVREERFARRRGLDKQQTVTEHRPLIAGRSVIDSLSRTPFDSEVYKHGNAELNIQLYLDEFERRGYDAHHLCEGLIEVIQNGDVGITGTRYSSLFCDSICDKVYPLRKLLALKGIPVARGARFKVSEMVKGLEYGKLFPDSLIITAIYAPGFTKEEISTKEEFKIVWEKVRDKGSKYIIIEEKTIGWHVCIAVVAGSAAGSVLLDPVSITGDGKSTIGELIEGKNEARTSNPWYRDRPVTVNKSLLGCLKRSGLYLDSIPEVGKRLLLETKMGLELGGEAIGAEGLLHHDFNKKAVEAVAAIPGLELAYVHMVVPFPDEPAEGQRWIVSHIDTHPAVGLFHFPWKGKPVNLVSRVVSELCLSKGMIWSTTSIQLR